MARARRTTTLYNRVFALMKEEATAQEKEGRRINLSREKNR